MNTHLVEALRSSFSVLISNQTISTRRKTMTKNRIHLKIKVQSLVDESKNIRKEANKTSGMAKWDLNHHRTSVVRPHTRKNLLAYGCLRGTPYHAMERKCDVMPNFSEVEKIARRFGGTEEDIASWIYDAKVHLKIEKKEAA
jgi:hypothetical protein